MTDGQDTWSSKAGFIIAARNLTTGAMTFTLAGHAIPEHFDVVNRAWNAWRISHWPSPFHRVRGKPCFRDQRITPFTIIVVNRLTLTQGGNSERPDPEP